MERTVAVILAGGKGSRLEPLTRDRAKPAVPLAGTPPHVDQTRSIGLSGAFDGACTAVPAISEVSRLDSPAKVAVRPLNMKMNTEKKATMP